MHLHKSELRLWPLTGPERRAVMLTFCLCLVARGALLIPGFSIDDYGLVHVPEHVTLEHTASGGRPLVAPLLAVLKIFAIYPGDAMLLSSLSLMCALIFAGLVSCRLLNIGDNIVNLSAVMSFMVLFPYQAEIFTFRVASVLLAIPLALMFAALYAPLINIRQWLGSVAAAITALCIYQTVLSYAAMVMVMMLGFQLLHGINTYAINLWKRKVMMLLLSLFGYFVVLKAVLAFTTSRHARLGVLSKSEEVVQRTWDVLALIKRILFVGEPVMPVAVKVMLLAILLCVFAAIIQDHARVSAVHSKSSRAMVFATLLPVGLLACVGVIIAIPGWWPVPRVLSQTGLFWGALLSLGLSYATPSLRQVLIILGTGALVSFVGINNTIVSEQIRLNRRDMAQALRIVSVIEQLPDPKSIKGICVHGGTWYYPSYFHTVQGDLNVSALSVVYAKTSLINEVSGKGYIAPDEATLSKAREYCVATPRWPDKSSVSRIGDFGVVCLPEEP